MLCSKGALCHLQFAELSSETEHAPAVMPDDAHSPIAVALTALRGSARSSSQSRRRLYNDDDSAAQVDAEADVDSRNAGAVLLPIMLLYIEVIIDCECQYAMSTGRKD